MATSPAPEPLPHGTEPLKAVPEAASLEAGLPVAPGRGRTTASPDDVWRTARATGRRPSMVLLQGGEQRAPGSAAGAQTPDDKRPAPNPVGWRPPDRRQGAAFLRQPRSPRRSP